MVIYFWAPNFIVTAIFLYTGWPKNWRNVLYALTLPNINRFSNLFHCQKQEKIWNKDFTTPQLCCCFTCEMSNVLKATIENKKLTTGNNLLIVSVIVQSNCHILQFFTSNVQCVPALLLDDALLKCVVTEVVYFYCCL